MRVAELSQRYHFYAWGFSKIENYDAIKGQILVFLAELKNYECLSIFASFKRYVSSTELGSRYLKSSGAAAIWQKKQRRLPLIAAQIKK